MSKRLEFVFFDFDDTLIDIGKTHSEAFRKALLSYGIEIEFNYKDLAGLETREAFESLGIDKKVSEELAKIKREIFIEISEEDYPRWNFGISNLLNYLDKCEISYAIVSSGTKSRIISTLAKLNSVTRFSFIISREDVYRSKPHPEPYLLALKKSSTNIEKALVVEDSLSGVKSALSAGLKVWQITDELEGNIQTSLYGSAESLQRWLTCQI